MFSLLISALLAATPANINAQMTAAKCGDTVQAVGNFSRINLSNLPCTATLDLTQANVTYIYANKAANWFVENGFVTGSSAQSIQVINSNNLHFSGIVLDNFGKTGIGLLTSNNIEIDHITFEHSMADATDIVSSQFVHIHDNKYIDLVYDNTILHADMVQMWSLVGSPITSDIEIDHNIGITTSQGFDSFGNGDGLPVQNINIHDNNVSTTMVWAGNFTNCQGKCSMVNNYAQTAFGQPHGWGGTVWVMTGPNVTFSGNTNGVAP